MAVDEVAPLNLSKKDGVLTSQAHVQGQIKNAPWGITDARSVKENNDDSTDEQKQTAAFALCQLAQWKLSEQTEDSSETTAHFSKNTETDANNVPNIHQISSTTLHDNCITSNPAVTPQNEISTKESDKTAFCSTERDKTDSSSKCPDPKSALDVNCPSPHPEGTTVIPSEPKTKGQTKARRRGQKKRSGDSIPNDRILRKRLRC